MLYYKITGKLNDEELAVKINDRLDGYDAGKSGFSHFPWD